MTGTLPFPRRRHTPEPGTMVRTEADLAALTAEEPLVVADSVVGLIPVRRYALGPDTRYDVGCVTCLAPRQAAALCLQFGVHAAGLLE